VNVEWHLIGAGHNLTLATGFSEGVALQAPAITETAAGHGHRMKGQGLGGNCQG